MRYIEHLPTRTSGDIKILAPDEVQLLCQAANDSQDAALWTVASYTGLRLGELLALRWRDLDWQRRILHVRRSYTYGEEGTPNLSELAKEQMCSMIER